MYGQKFLHAGIYRDRDGQKKNIFFTFRPQLFPDGITRICIYYKGENGKAFEYYNAGKHKIDMITWEPHWERRWARYLWHDGSWKPGQKMKGIAARRRILEQVWRDPSFIDPYLRTGGTVKKIGPRYNTAHTKASAIQEHGVPRVPRAESEESHLFVDRYATPIDVSEYEDDNRKPDSEGNNARDSPLSSQQGPSGFGPSERWRKREQDAYGSGSESDSENEAREEEPGYSTYRRKSGNETYLQRMTRRTRHAKDNKNHIIKDTKTIDLMQDEDETSADRILQSIETENNNTVLDSSDEYEEKDIFEEPSPSKTVRPRETLRKSLKSPFKSPPRPSLTIGSDEEPYNTSDLHKVTRRWQDIRARAKGKEDEIKNSNNSRDGYARRERFSLPAPGTKFQQSPSFIGRHRAVKTATPRPKWNLNPFSPGYRSRRSLKDPEIPENQAEILYEKDESGAIVLD